MHLTPTFKGLVQDVLIVDGRGNVVGKGFPIGQFQFGFDPTELWHWKPRQWIGFVSAAHLPNGTAECKLRGFVRLRESQAIVPLEGAMTADASLVPCPEQGLIR